MVTERSRADPVLSFPLLEEAGKKLYIKVINLDMNKKGKSERRDDIIVIEQE
jgi:hypothetical protein